MPKREEAGSLPISERHKLQRLYIQGGGADGSVRNSAKTSGLPGSKVRHFLNSKPSDTKFSLGACKYKRKKAFARLKNKLSCLDLAYVNKLIKNINVVNPLIRQDLCVRVVDAKRMKTKASKETVCSFLTMITKNNRPKKNSVNKGAEIAGEFKNHCKVEK